METYVQWIVSLGASLLDASQLSNDLYGLRISLPKARLLIERGEWGMFKTKENEEVGRLLSQLKDTTGDAEDLLREFDDQMLRHKMETEERNKAGQFVSSSVNLFKSWISGSKTKVKEAQSKLDKATSEMGDALNIMGVNSEQMQFMPETSSFINFQVMGRDEERDVVIEKLGVMIGRENKRDQVIELLGVPLTRGHTSAGTTRKRAALDIGETSTPISKRLKGKNRSGLSVAIDHCVPVLAIFGIGGMGKTTLAQFVYNDTRVENHFDVRMWVCVSDRFNKKRIIKEIIESIIDQEFSSPLNSDDALEDQLKEQLKEKRFNSSSSLNTLEGLLKKQLTEKKFLLVLDDMWPDANGKWEAFYALLGHGLEGSMVLVTTRCPKVADHVATVEPVPLNGLPVDIFWEFFKKCAFDKHCPDSYPELQDIGHTIADKLCGSPLAAKTLGRLLNDSLTEDHWKCIQNSELWQLPHDENGIMPALQLSYLYLPQELKRCFAVCSMFPKDRSFEKDEIVDFWVAQGFFAPGVSIRIEDTGYRCLDDLRSRFLFQTDPRFPQGSRFVMHDLIHDMAQSVSKDECFLMQESRCQNQIIPHTVRHMSIEVKNEEVLSRLTGLQHLNKLRSLRFGTRLTAEISWFSGLSNILFLSLNGCRLAKLPDALCLLNHVRHLDISHSGIHELPEKFWCLFSLQVFDAYRSSLKTIQEGVTKLVNLRRLALPAKASMDLSRISGLGNLSCLRNLSYFTVGSVNGRRICELKGMNQLSGTLHIKSIGSVQRMEEAAEASLVDKRYLKELVLQWRGIDCALKSRENGVFQALLPPPEIEHLKVEGFGGDIAPSWLGPENLPSLRTIELAWCKSLKQLALHGVTTFRDGTPAPPPTGDDRMQHTVINSGNGNVHLSFTRLTNLRLNRCEGLVNLDQFLCPDYMPSLRSIQIVWCRNLVSLPVHNFVGFACLQDLKIHGCKSVVRPGEMVLPHSLQRLSIYDPGELDKSFRPCFLENLASLTVLDLEDCPNVESILLNSTSTNNLKYLLVRSCSKLSSIGGSHALSSIQHVVIVDCPQLTEVQQPWLSRGLGTMEEREILKFTIRHR